MIFAQVIGQSSYGRCLAIMDIITHANKQDNMSDAFYPQQLEFARK